MRHIQFQEPRFHQFSRIPLPGNDHTFPLSNYSLRTRLVLIQPPIFYEQTDAVYHHAIDCLCSNSVTVFRLCTKQKSLTANLLQATLSACFLFFLLITQKERHFTPVFLLIAKCLSIVRGLFLEIILLIIIYPTSSLSGITI